MMDQQAQQLSRVRDKLASTILRFCRKRVGETFHAMDLVRYCRVLQPEIAPDSPGRILRDLRSEGALSYSVLSRQHSTYIVHWVVPERARA